MARPRVAIIGASQDRGQYSNQALRAHQRAGYEVYPVHPRHSTVEGLPAFRTIEEVPPGHLDRVSLYVPPAVALVVLRQVARRGAVGQVWLNPGVDDPMVLDLARELGLPVVQGCSLINAREQALNEPL